MEELLKYAQKAIARYPKLLKDIEGLVDLCKDEIEQGESADHEIELCKEDIRQLLEEDNDD
jgi:hypothetical protein